jgi:hypothetical protein
VKENSEKNINCENSDESDSDEEELEIVPRESPKSIFDFFGESPKVKKPKKKSVTNHRKILRNNLRAKQYQNGNKWLAR